MAVRCWIASIDLEKGYSTWPTKQKAWSVKLWPESATNTKQLLEMWLSKAHFGAIENHKKAVSKQTFE